MEHHLLGQSTQLRTATACTTAQLGGSASGWVWVWEGVRAKTFQTVVLSQSTVNRCWGLCSAARSASLVRSLGCSPEAAHSAVSVLGQVGWRVHGGMYLERSAGLLWQQSRVGGGGGTLDGQEAVGFLRWLVKQSIHMWRCGRLASRLCRAGAQMGIRLPLLGSGAAGYLRPGICPLGTEPGNWKPSTCGLFLL